MVFWGGTTCCRVVRGRGGGADPRNWAIPSPPPSAQPAALQLASEDSAGLGKLACMPGLAGSDPHLPTSLDLRGWALSLSFSHQPVSHPQPRKLGSPDTSPFVPGCGRPEASVGTFQIRKPTRTKTHGHRAIETQI